MEDLLILTLFVLVAVLMLGFPVRIIACAFSGKIRQAVRRRWLLHSIWGLLAILCFLVGVIPMYPGSDYTARAKVQEGLSLASVARAAVNEFRLNQGRFPASNAQAAIADKIDGTYVESVLIGPQGIITVTYRQGNLLPNKAGGRTIVLRPKVVNDGVEWNCKGGDMPDKYRSRSCRR